MPSSSTLRGECEKCIVSRLCHSDLFCVSGLFILGKPASSGALPGATGAVKERDEKHRKRPDEKKWETRVRDSEEE